MKPVALVGIVCCMLLALANAAEAPPAAADPELEKRVMQLAAELRCLVCQNQSIAESNADLARDLKNQVREMIKAGKSDADIRAYMVARYGDFVLFRPPLKASTMPLWTGPFALLLAAGLAFAIYLRRRRARVGERALTPEERARAQVLLAADDRGKNP